MITKYQPFKLIYNHPQPICTMSYNTKEEAIAYAKSRNLKDDEIFIKEHLMEEEYIRNFQ